MAGLATELEDVTEVEYRQLRLERVVLIGVWAGGTQAEADNSMAELAALAETAGSLVLEGLMQRRDKPDAATYIGSGKARELRDVVVSTGAAFAAGVGINIQRPATSTCSTPPDSRRRTPSTMARCTCSPMSGCSSHPTISFSSRRFSSSTSTRRATASTRRGSGRWSATAQKTAEAPQVVVAIGDVHGDFDDFCPDSETLGLIDENLHWAGSHAILVRRGTCSIAARRNAKPWIWMRSLEDEAAKVGGQAVTRWAETTKMMNLMET